MNIIRVARGMLAMRELRRRRQKREALAREAILDQAPRARGPLSLSPLFVVRTCGRPEVAPARGLPQLPPRPAVPVQPYLPPDYVLPRSAAEAVLAMDDQLSQVLGNQAAFFSALGFPGFPYLTELTQITEYRDMFERASNEMVRKWIKLRSVSKDGTKAERIKILEADMRKFRVRDAFRQCATLDGSMGRGQLFIDLGDTGGPELETPLMLNRFKIPVGSLRGFKVVEPITTYPANYNASNPLAQDYYVPSVWFVYGQKVHSTRLLQFVSRALPDLLKPVYNFSGMSLSQLGQPYVDYWINTRDSVGRLLRNFSTTALTTDMGDALSGGEGEGVTRRAQVFVQQRDNQGLFLLDKSREEQLTQLNVPLSGLADLQAQAQEHMAAVAKTPLVILFGITPKGLNATAEGDIRVFYSYVSDQQEVLFRKNFDTVLKVLMLNAFGEVDEDITFDFVPLFEMSAKELAEIRKSDADEATALVTIGAVTGQDVRAKIASDPDSGWDDLAVEDLDAEAEQETGEEDDERAGGGTATPDPGAQAGAAGPESPADAAGGQALDAASVLMLDAVAADEGFLGNQHTGPMRGSKVHPYDAATRASAFARKATNRASLTGSRKDHRAAEAAHRRAMDAHHFALRSAPAQAAPVHLAYVDAHRAAIDAHASAGKEAR